MEKMKKDSKIGGLDIYIRKLDYKECQEIEEC